MAKVGQSFSTWLTISSIGGPFNKGLNFAFQNIAYQNFFRRIFYGFLSFPFVILKLNSKVLVLPIVQ
jgi:hypothetical protein